MSKFHLLEFLVYQNFYYFGILLHHNSTMSEFLLCVSYVTLEILLSLNSVMSEFPISITSEFHYV